MDLKRTNYFGTKTYKYRNGHGPLGEYKDSDPNDTIEQVLKKELMELTHSNIVYDGRAFSKVTPIAINHTEETYDLVIEVETMPPNADVPKGLVELLKKHGFERKLGLAKQIQDYFDKFKSELRKSLELPQEP